MSLPLPTHFTLLPSQLPTRTLTPCFHVIVNDLPIYLTLSPSHAPHLSLLPLLLALYPVPPIHLLTRSHVQLSEIDLTLDGIAPFPDLWVPFPVARRFCEALALSPLFWDDQDPTSGLLGRGTEGCVSWDEGPVIGHNWLPSKSALPPSRYSLVALCETTIPGAIIIPDEQCIATPIDAARRVKIESEAEFGDHSRVRGGAWDKAWHDLLVLTLGSWEAFLAHPSRPPPDPPPRRQPQIAMALHRLLPYIAASTLPTHLPSIASSAPHEHSYTPTLADLSALLDPILPAPRSTFRALSSAAIDCLLSLSPFRRTQLSPPELKLLELRARCLLGVADASGQILMERWRTEREMARLKAIIAGKRHSMPPTIVIGDLAAGRPVPSASCMASSGLVTAAQAVDELAVLEERRGGSPPASPFLPRQEAASTRRRPPRSSLSHRRLPRASSSGRSSASSSSSESPGPVPVTAQMTAESTQGAARDSKMGTLLSEGQDGWRLYGSVVACIVLAVLMGRLT